jgi:hypothetical protein
MHCVGDLLDVALEQPAGIRVGEHDARNVAGPSLALKRFQINATVLGGRNGIDACSRRQPLLPGWCRGPTLAPEFRVRLAASPRASSAARIAIRPHSSPWAPALGDMATACVPVEFHQPMPASSFISSSRARARLIAAATGAHRLKPGSRAIFSLRRGLCFMVHEPSG